MRLKRKNIPDFPVTILLPTSKSLAARWLALNFLLENKLSFQPLQSPSEDIQVFLNAKEKKIYLNQSGTAYRFLIAAAGLRKGEFIFTGKNSLFRRPIIPLLETLHQAGIRTEQGENYIKVQGTSDLQKDYFIVDASLSSQFLSALLLLAPKLKKGTKIFLKNHLASPSFANFTIKFLENAGYYWTFRENYFVLTGKNPRFPDQISIEADWSAASYFLLYASLNKSELVLKNLQENSLQPDRKVLELLKNIDWNFSNEGLRVKNETGKPQKPINEDFSEIPDMAQGFAVFSAMMNGTSFLKGLETLRYKETDRISALQKELAKTGTEVSYANGTMQIKRKHKRLPFCFDTYEDHRMAMALSLFVSEYEEICIRNPEVVRKTFPAYWREFARLGIEINELAGT